MKVSILLDMLFDLLSKRKVTAAYFSEKYNLSPRTVYRYVEVLSQDLPLFVKRGRNGGICLSDSYRLPVGFMTAEEYSAAIDALGKAYARSAEPRYLNARRKLSAQVKTERNTLTVAGDSNGFFIEEPLPTLTGKARIVNECIREERLLECTYTEKSGEVLTGNIEPHAMLFRHGVWYVYAFCHLRRAFHVFSLGRLTALRKTEEFFRKRPFEPSDIPLAVKTEQRISIRLKILETALPAAQEKWGIEPIKYRNGEWIAELSLPEDIALQTVFSFGAGVEILSPSTLRKKAYALASELAKKYE